ncbi:MAG: M23 family metallopeptidase [Gaiellales bacterium]
MPPLPVRSDSAAAGETVRGALTVTPTWNDDFRGWPVAPQHRTHAVYGTFLNPTTKWPSEMPGPRAGGHKAIDILQNDATGRHPVFAIEGGTVREATLDWILNPLKERVRSGKISIGHFHYSHVAPSVEVGEKVEAGQEIGQTCLGFWHMHLEERATAGGKRVHLNPLRPGGKLAPVTDKGNPFVREMRIYAKADENNGSPRPLPPDRVRGVVVPVALAMDSFPFREWPGAPTVPLHVYRASIELRRGQTTVLSRTLFQLDMQPGPIWQHFFRPLTRRSAPIAVCIVREPADCTGKLWIRLWERGWDTRKVPNGSYTLKLTVEDTVGRSASKTLRLRVAN